MPYVAISEREAFANHRSNPTSRHRPVTDRMPSRVEAPDVIAVRSPTQEASNGSAPPPGTSVSVGNTGCAEEVGNVRSSISAFLIALLFAIALNWGMLPLIYRPSEFGF